MGKLTGLGRDEKGSHGATEVGRVNREAFLRLFCDSAAEKGIGIFFGQNGEIKKGTGRLSRRNGCEEKGTGMFSSQNGK